MYCCTAAACARIAHKHYHSAMPKRSNDFQKLVYLIQKQLGDRPDVVVTESKFLKDRVSGDEREVDIAVESSVNGIPFILAFECADRSRKPGIEWVQQMLKKHEHLSDKLVLVAGKAFVGKAAKAAKRDGAETVELSDATKRNWPSLLDEYQKLVFASFDLRVKSRAIEYFRPTAAAELELDKPVDVIDMKGVRAPIDVLVQKFIEDRDVGTRIMDLWFDKPLAERREQHEATLPYVPQDDQPMTLVQGALAYRLIKLVVVAEVRVGLTPLSMAQAGYRNMGVVHGQATLPNGSLVGQSVRFVVTQEEGKPPKAALMLTGTNGTDREVVRIADLTPGTPTQLRPI